MFIELRSNNKVHQTGEKLIWHQLRVVELWLLNLQCGTFKPMQINQFT